ncbi:MAG: hypothetical protein QCI00_10040 [Candidatus Thermoplasmatota archaeon]|nr:hypothetical protein [Candidatus Thermoplasmatota archaeon]
MKGKNKIGTIFFVSMLALAGIGISYAGFTDMITISGSVTTGTVEMNVVDYSGTWLWKVWGSEQPTDEVIIFEGKTSVYTEDYMLGELTRLYPDCDYEKISYAYAKEGTQGYDVDMIFSNIFPCTEYTADVYIHYIGSVPAHVNVTDFTYPVIFDRSDLWDWDFIAQKGIINPTTGGYDYTETSFPVQLHDCNHLYIEFMLHMLQPSDVNDFQGQEYSFSFNINAIQWYDPCDNGVVTPGKELVLPDQMNAKIRHPGNDCYWGVEIKGLPDPTEDVYSHPINIGADLKGWCVDLGHNIAAGTYDFSVHYDGENAQESREEVWEGNKLLAPEGSTPWNCIDYILNHKGTCSWEDIQYAIWYFIDGGNNPGGDAGDLIDDTLDNVVDWLDNLPEEDLWVAVLLNVNLDGVHRKQLIIIEVDP